MQIEQDEYLETFQSYRHRYRMDYEPAYSDDPLYYSVDIGRESLLKALHLLLHTVSTPAQPLHW